MSIDLMLKPSFNTVRDSMGFGPNDDYSSDSVLYEQGFNSEIIEVEDGDIIEVREGYTGVICSDDDYYYALFKDDVDFHKDEDEISEDDINVLSEDTIIELEEGRYKFFEAKMSFLQLDDDFKY